MKPFQAILLIAIAFGISFVAMHHSGDVVTDISNIVTTQSQLAQAAPTSGLVGYWNFDEGSGTTAADTSGGGNNGALTNGPTWTAGKIGQALNFTGSNDTVVIQNSASLSGMSSITVSAWVKPSQVGPTVKFIFVKGHSSAPWSSYYLSLNSDNTANFNVKTSASGAESYNPTVLQVGQWYHVVGVYNGANVSVYVNGQQGSYNPALTGSVFSSNDVSYISYSPYFAGAIDDVRIYNRALSASEISQLYAYTGSGGGGGAPADTTAPSVPTNLAGTAVSSSQINLTWTASTDDTAVTGYKVYRNGTQVGTPSTNSYSDTGLSASTQYAYAVSANDAAGNNSSQTAAITVTTQTTQQGDTTPPVISAINAGSITSSAATITWTTNESSDSQVEYGLTTSYGSITSLNTSLVTSHSVSLTGLSPNTQYHYRVKSKDASSNLSTSGDSTLTTPAASQSDTTAPSTPTNLTATAVSSSQINLSWTASTDNTAVTGYRVLRGGVEVGTPSTNAYSDTSLSASTQYSYTVSAYDAANNSSSQSTSASATTQGGSGASAIPSDRLIDWSQAGVPGGIPSASWTVCQTLSPSGGDDTSAIHNALNNCGNATNNPSQGKVVYLNAGTYKISAFTWQTSTLGRGTVPKNNIVLRGAGPDKTVLKTVSGYSGGGNIQFGNGDAWPPFAGSTIMNISGGATKGASSLTVSSGASASMVGSLMHISQTNGTFSSNTVPNGNIVVSGIGNEGTGPDPVADRDRDGNARNLQQVVKVTSVSGNTISFTPPLYWSYSSANSPQATVVKETVHQVGVEDLKIDNSAAPDKNNSAYAAIAFWFADQCWIKNVETSYARNGFFLYATQGCEVRDSYFHIPVANVFQDGSDSGYNQLAISSNDLIENNIFTNMLAPTVFAGASGNVVGYNYYKNIRAGDITNIIAAINTNHGAHGLFNLTEGNTANLYQSDDYYGSSSHGMLFRNNLIGTDTGVTQRRKPVSLDSKQTYYSVIGNVLGTSALSGWTYEVSGGSAVPDKVIYRLGYQGLGEDSTGNNDLTVKTSLLRGGNYDYATQSVVWSNNAPNSASTYLSSQTLPASLYKYSRPSWFGGTAWPAVGPDVSGYVSIIPAQQCYNSTVAIGAAFTSATCYGTTSTPPPTTYTVSVTSSGTGSGSVTSSVGGISCGATCTSSALTSGTSVTLTATASSGSTFSGWGGSCSGTGSCVLTVSSNTTVTASFTLNAVPDTTAPTTPSGVSATAISSSATSLTWTASTDAVGVTGYNIYRCQGTTCTATSLVGTSPTNSYSDSGLSASTAYRYRVKAYDAAGNLSGYSSSASVTTQSAVSTYTVSVTSSGTGSGSVTSSVGGISCGATCTSSALTSGTSVTLTATASSGSTFSGWGGSCSGTGSCVLTVSSNTTVTASFTLNAVPDTTAPTVSMTSPSNGSTISNSVTLSASASDNVGVVGVQFKLDGSSLGSELTTAPYSGGWDTNGVSNGSHTLTAVARDAAGNTKTATTITVTVNNVIPTYTLAASRSGTGDGTISGGGLSCGTTCVTTVNTGTAVTLIATPVSGSTFQGWSGACSGSNSCTITISANTNVSASFALIPDTTAPTTPTGLTSSSVTQTSLNLSWNASADAVGVTGYKVYRNGTQIASPTTNTYAVTGLSANTQYTFTVSAYDLAGNTSSQSSSYSVTTAAVPVITYTLTSTRSGTGSGIVTGNGLNCGSTCTASITSGTSVTLTATAISGSTFAGWSSPCFGTGTCTTTIFNNTSINAIFTINPDTTAPTTPTNLNATAVSTSQVNLTWSASTDSTGVTGYKIYRNGAQIAISSNNSYSNNGLSPNTTYIYTVSAYDAAGNESNTSTANSATTNSLPDTQAPTAPTALAPSSLTQTTVTISWSASADNVGVTGYNLYRNGTLIASPTTNTYAVSGLSANTLYTFTASAYDNAGNTSSLSSPLSIITSPIPVTTYTLTSTKGGTGSGTISGNGLNCGSTCTASVTQGTSISLTATPSADSTFDGWTAVCTGSGTCNTTISGNTTIAAIFTLIPSTTGGGNDTGGNTGGGGGGGNTYVPPPITGTFTPTVTQAPAVTSNTSNSVAVTTPCTSSSSSSFTRSLTTGADGADVKALQVFLNNKGFKVSTSGAGAPGQETSYFGPATTRAVAAFQLANQISPPAGYFGPLTMKAVNALLGTTSSCPTTNTVVPTITTTSSSFTRDLQLGDDGLDVKALQVYLNTHGFPVALTSYGSLGNETEHFGPATVKALGLFQAANGIVPPAGYFGPKTRAVVGK